MSVFSVLRRRILLGALVLAAALLMAAACTGDGDGEETPMSGQTPAADDTPAGNGATATIGMIPGIRFDTAELTIAAGSDVTIIVDNTDTGIPHNFAVYTSREAAEGGEEALAATDICTAPCTDTVTLNLTAGEYFFRCEVHPAQMTGTLFVR